MPGVHTFRDELEFKTVMLNKTAPLNRNLLVTYLPAITAVLAGLGWWLFDAGLMIYWHDRAAVEALLPAGEPAARRFVVAIAIAGAAFLGAFAHNFALRERAKRAARAPIPAQLLLESTFDSVLTLDKRAMVVAANEAAHRLLGNGVARAPVSVDRFISIVPTRRSTAVNDVLDLLEQSDVWTYRTLMAEVTRADGSPATAELRIIRDPDPAASGYIFLLRECRDEAGAQEALRRTREKYLELFEQMPDGVFRSCRDGTLLTANPALVAMLGYASERELCEQVNLFDLFLFGEQRDQLLEQVELDGHAHNVELDLRRKDLTEVVVKANVMRVPGGPDGESVLQGTLADITDLRDATDALRDSEEHFRALTDNTADLISVIDEDARLLYCSPASERVLGFQAFELNGKCSYDLVHPEDVDATRESVATLFSEPGKRKPLDFRALHRDGSYIHMESVGSAFVDSKGQLRAVVSSRDVSSKRLEHDRQTQTHKLAALGQLTGGIAHDFNNLLTVIVGCLQLIDDGQNDAEVSNQIELALRAAMRGSELNRQLLAFARCQPLDPQPVRIYDLLRDIEPALRSVLGPKIATHIECPDDAWWIKVDPEQLENAILSLAANSAEACNGRGNLTISISNREACPTNRDATDVEAAEPCECLCIAVADDGCGMTAEVRKRAVDPFFTTKEHSSSGLGLSMVYGFARQSGGFLQIGGTEGRGATVEVFLPRHESPKTRATDRRNSGVVPSGSERVLIVDDDANVLASASELVRDLGYDVVKAGDADAALQVLEASGADLLFSDIRMPGMTGFELASVVQSQYPETRILLTSGFTDHPVLPDGESVDGFEFIPKPYRKQNLAERIRAVLDHTS